MNPNEHEAYLREALALADEAAAWGDVPVGALVVHDGAVVGRGANRREVDADPLAHAELLAMRQAAETLGTWRLDDCTLYVTLEPCAMCAGAMVQARLGRCVYGCRDPKAGFAGSLANLAAFPGTPHQVDVVEGVLASDCREMLTQFFRVLRDHDTR